MDSCGKRGAASAPAGLRRRDYGKWHNPGMLRAQRPELRGGKDRDVGRRRFPARGNRPPHLHLPTIGIDAGKLFFVPLSLKFFLPREEFLDSFSSAPSASSALRLEFACIRGNSRLKWL